MDSKQRKWLKLLEKQISSSGQAEWRDYRAGAPKEWKKFPLCYDGYGPREGCVRVGGVFWRDEDSIMSIVELFYAFYSTARDILEGELNLGCQGAIRLTVTPCWTDRSFIVLYQESTGRVVYSTDWKAWNLAFETPEELADELIDVYESMKLALKIRLPFNAGELEVLREVVYDSKKGVDDPYRLQVLSHVSMVLSMAEGVLDPCDFAGCYTAPRQLDKDGHVVSSHQTVWKLSEVDILDKAREMKVKLTEDEIIAVHKGIESGLGCWDEVVGCAIGNVIEERKGKRGL